MYCSSCGSQLIEGGRYCTVCGAEVKGKNVSSTIETEKSKLIGYSPKINDPAFYRYIKNSKRWSFVFAVILALIAVIAFPLYGEKSGELEWPLSLFYGIGIGGMFIFIAAVQTVLKASDSTWDGVVIDKKIYNRRKWDKDNDMYIDYTVYEYFVRRDNGKIYSHRTEDDMTVYNYYNIGDKVRHHKGLGLYEKYDKSKDEFLFCTACSSINEINEEYCFRCKCPLLK